MYGERQIFTPDGQVNSQPAPSVRPSPISSHAPLAAQVPVAQGSAHKKANKNSTIKTDWPDIGVFFAVFGGLFVIIGSFFSFGSYPDGIMITAGYLFLFALATVYIVTKTKHFPIKAVFPAALCIAVAMSFSYNYSSPFSISVSFIMLLSGIYCMSLADISPFGGYIDSLKGLLCTFALPVCTVYMPIVGLFQHSKPKKIGKYVGVLVGIILAVPVFILVAYLLTEGDAAFGNLLGGAFKYLEKLFEKYLSFESAIYAVLALIFTPYVASTMFSFRHGVIGDIYKRSQKIELSDKLHFIPDTFTGGFYGAVSLCYVIYLISQLTYLFGAFSGNIPIGVSVTLSQYARRGFFEMSAVAFINLCLIAVGVAFSKRKNGQLSKVFKGFAVFFCLFTIMLIITAMSKMGLYITEMGLTYKRIQVTLIDLVLLVVFISILIRLFAKRFPYMKIIVFTALSVLTVYCTVGPDRVIGSFNTYAYLSGYHERIDLDNLYYMNSEYQSLKSIDRIAAAKCKASPEAKAYVYRIYDWQSGEFLEEKASLHLEASLIKDYISTNEERIKSYEPEYIYYDYGGGYDSDEDYVTSDYVSFVISTEKEIKSITFSNPYNSITLTDTEDAPFDRDECYEFDWKYRDEIDSTFASILVTTKDGSVYPCTVSISSLPDSDPDDASTCIVNYSMCFELRDNAHGGLMLVETEY